MKERAFHYEAAGVCDAAGTEHAPGALLVAVHDDGTSILAVGSPDEVAVHPAAAAAARRRFADGVIIPALVNAHTHLDLTHIGPQPCHPDTGFVGWIDIIRTRRHTDPAAIRDAVRAGIDLSLQGGVIAVGDIAGVRRPEPMLQLRNSPQIGVSFLETFGVGPRQALGADDLRHAVQHRADHASDPVRLGLQPHAPYSAGLDLYHAAADLALEHDLPIATHLAETSEERQFVQHGTGPLRDLLERLGVWNDTILEEVGRGRHPVEHLAPVLRRIHMLVAHANDCPDDALAILAAARTSVAYCPRCADSFGHAVHFGPHRYLDMTRAGINVCLGTDSIVSLPCADRLSPLDEMRHLHGRDAASPHLLLRMATMNGARALGIPESLFRFTPGERIAGVAVVDVTGTNPAPPATRILEARAGIELLHPQVHR